MKQMSKVEYQKLLYKTYTAYLKANTPLDKAIWEDKVQKLIEWGEKTNLVGEKDKDLEEILNFYWQYLKEVEPIQKEKLEVLLTELIAKYETNNGIDELAVAN